MIRLISARRLEALERTEADLERMRAELAAVRTDHHASTADLLDRLQAARGQVARLRQAVDEAEERADDLAALAAPPPAPAPRRVDQWCWVHIALLVGAALAEEHDGREELAGALEQAEEQVRGLLAAEYQVGDGHRREVAV
ncbi:hypothetical protein [Nocardiopsis potens]|uniref:hypothetical protein n=1 Tax=Nocardiopsis potens TaxID=1246458 RepID=UPI00034604F5|nr:hypothetical protein [Nocardiopsis potens]